MTRILLLFCGLIFINSTVFAQSKAEKQVASVVEKLRVAMVEADGKVLNELVLDKLQYGHSSGRIENKTEFMQALTSGNSDFKSIVLTEQTLQVVGKAAVVRHFLSAETNDKGVPGTVKLAVLMIWQKHRGQWRLWDRQAVKI